MSQLQEWEKAGLRDFFTFDVRTEAIAIDMAKFFLSRVSITSPKTSAGKQKFSLNFTLPSFSLFSSRFYDHRCH